MRGLQLSLLLVPLFGCDTGDPPDLSSKLVARYPMDDLAGGMASDISGNNHHATCSTCPGVVEGKALSAYSFDGGDQQLDVPADAAFDSRARGISAAVWVKVDVAPPAIPGCALVKGAMWSICVTPQLQPAFGSFNATGSTLTLGTWHHIAVTWDIETKRIFLDGTEVGALPGSLVADTAGLSIGPELVGFVDEAQVFEGVLTDDEIADLVTP